MAKGVKATSVVPKTTEVLNEKATEFSYENKVVTFKFNDGREKQLHHSNAKALEVHKMGKIV